MYGHARGLLDGRAAGDERRPAAGRNRGLGLWRASQNRDVTPAAWLTRAWLTRTDGRAGGYKRSRRRAVGWLVNIKGEINIAVCDQEIRTPMILIFEFSNEYSVRI